MDHQDRLLHFKKKMNNRTPHIIDHEHNHQSAVLVPLISMKNEWHVLFEIRSQRLRRQPGEICFPGGRVEREDRNVQDTAVRETCEELGLHKKHIQVLATLDFLPTSHHSIIYPFVGLISDKDFITPNPDEVEEVFLVPIEHFMKNEPEKYDLHLIPEPEEAFPYHLIPKGENYDWRKARIPEYFYYYEDYVIWGLTARILRHFIYLYQHC